ESSYNAPRLHVAMQARKIVISGEVAGLQIQLGTPAFPGRFDSCDLPPSFLTLYHVPSFPFVLSLPSKLRKRNELGTSYCYHFCYANKSLTRCKSSEDHRKKLRKKKY